MKANIPSLYNRNNDPNFVENEKNKAEAANQYALALEKQNNEIAAFTTSQFSDDFVESPRLQLEIPNYSVENYIEERAKWTKGITSIADEPGWFYFKIFFKFFLKVFFISFKIALFFLKSFLFSFLFSFLIEFR